MGAKTFEIGLFDPSAARGAMLPRVWDLDTLLRSVSWLRLKNAEGGTSTFGRLVNIALSLIDDASIQVIERLKSEGFAPAVVLETSPGNFQAWLHHGQSSTETSFDVCGKATGLTLWRRPCFGGLAALRKTRGLYES